jgi:dTDP-4-dehydrorhamnose reductase
MKILILGSGGMAGHIINNRLKSLPHFTVYSAAREKVNADTFIFNADEKNSVIAVFDQVKPDIVINAVGVLVKQANQNPANAILINSYFPHMLSQLAKERDSYVIHLSTDCVFSGHKGNYLVTDARDAADFYGKSKGLGELNNENDLTIRTSIIGPEIKNGGTGLLDWYLKSSGTISGYRKVFWSGITTLELCAIVEKSIALQEKGLIQISNNEKISKYGLLILMAKYFNKDAKLIEKEDKTIHDKSLLSSVPVERYNVPGYENMIKALSEYVLTNKNIYGGIYPQLFN